MREGVTLRAQVKPTVFAKGGPGWGPSSRFFVRPAARGATSGRKGQKEKKEGKKGARPENQEGRELRSNSGSSRFWRRNLTGNLRVQVSKLT